MVCDVCKKGPSVGCNKPNSQHRTKRTIKPNLQKSNGKNICTACLRTATNKVKKTSR